LTRSCIPLLFLVGCGGANDETLVDELRVMAIVAEPPEVAPGAESAVSVYVADPTAVDPDVLTWTCTNLGDGCLEASDPAQGTTVSSLDGGTIGATVVASAALAGVVADGETVFPVLTWALACAPGTCPVIDLAASQPDSGSQEAEELAAFLADPFTAVADLPLEGTSLAYSQVGVSMRDVPLVNPTLLATEPEPVVAAGGEVDLAFTAEGDGAMTAYGYTTLGGFGATSYDVTEGSVTMTWFGPEAAGDAALWVIVNGEDGGSAVWTGVGAVK